MKWNITECKRIAGMKDPGELFSGDKSAIKKEYQQLVKKWHPDNIKHMQLDGSITDADMALCEQAMLNINLLYDKGQKMIEAGTWKKPGTVIIPIKNGKKFEISYRKECPFELGKMYIADHHVTYLIDNIHEDLYRNAIKAMQSFTYKDKDMEKEFSKYMPTMKEKFETSDGQLGLIIGKTPDLLRLSDVLEHYNGQMNERHVAWVLSSLYNIACYLQFTGKSHNAITLDNYFISPQYHSGALLGGWWYSVGIDKPMLGTNAEIYSIMPPKVKHWKMGCVETDLEAVRLIGRTLLGDASGALLAKDSIPKALANWVRGAAGDNAMQEYKQWGDCITASWGKREFIKIKLTADDVYKKGA